jgi:DNA-binding NtrC family response regulator
MSATLLIIDDDRSIRKAFSMILSNEYEIHTASDGRKGLDELQKAEPDLVLLDIGLPDMDGLEVLKRLKKAAPDTAVIMITAYQDIRMVVEAIKLGAYDYLVKPIDSQELQVTVKNCLENRLLKNRLLILQHAERTRHGNMFIGSSQAMRKISRLIDKVALGIDTPVLITGETGSGKGVLARNIHFSSPNSQGPFITVNCGAIAGELVESELFGYGKGAFTGARAGGRKGRFEEAAGGTLFLDEIGVMPLTAQTKLLNILEDRIFYRVGGNKKIKVTARIIAATNLNLEEAVAAGTFRQDLYFRLNVITIAVPSLRERTEDILPLFKQFMTFFNQKTGKQFTSISAEASDLLLQYNWPGNVRELRNIMERISLLESGNTILPEHLPFAGSCRPHETPQAESAASPAVNLDYDGSKKLLIKQALQQTNGNITRAAQLLNMAPHKLRYRMKKLAIKT